MSARIGGATRRSGISIVALIFAVLAAGASAAPPLTVRLVSRPASLTAGTPWTATVAIRRAGKPLLGARVALTARLGSEGRSAQARSTGRGLYRARLVLPTAGRWLLTARVSTRSFELGAVLVRRQSAGPTPRITQAFGIALTGDGGLLVADRANRVLRLDLATGRSTSFAGTGIAGSSGDGGPAIRARINFPRDVAVDRSGGVYVAEGPRVRYVDPNGTISTFFTATDVVSAITLAPDGPLYVCSFDHSVVRIDPATRTSSAFAGTRVGGFNGDGRLATETQINRAHGLLALPDGALLIGDTDNHRIRRVDPSSLRVSTIAGTGEPGYGGDGRPATAALLNNPSYLAGPADGSVVFGDFSNNRVRRISRDGVIRTIAGNGGADIGEDGRPATDVPIGGPGGVAVDAAGNVYFVTLFGLRVRRVDAATGLISSIGGGP